MKAFKEFIFLYRTKKSYNRSNLKFKNANKKSISLKDEGELGDT